jgi:hypothetical protein
MVMPIFEGQDAAGRVLRAIAERREIDGTPSLR